MKIFANVCTEDLAWAAGFFEGEGCFSGKIIVVNTDLEPLQKLFGIFKFGTIKPRKITLPRHKPQWKWEVWNFQHIQFIVGSMWKWLSEKRKQQATRLLEAMRKRWSRGSILCKAGLHRLEGDNLYMNPRANRKDGKPFRRCVACAKASGQGLPK
jgi:hypothetical protein